MKILFLLLFFFSGLAFLASFFVPEEFFIYLSAGGIHAGLFAAAMFFLWKKDLKTTIESIGFPGKAVPTLIYSLAGLMAIFAAMFVLGLFSIIFDFNDQELVANKIADLPIFILAFAVVAAPISEELFFRGFLLRTISGVTNPIIGIIGSSIAFGFVHFAYGSIIEILGTLMIGIILAIVFHKSKSITPCMLIHMSYNLLAVIVMRFFT
jgi:membrane protease YdiL (CAAX protease family)